MPMIDVYATTGTFKDRKTLAMDLAAAVMRWEAVPPIALRTTPAPSSTTSLRTRFPTSAATATTSASRC